MEMAENEGPVLCFQHCDSQKRVFCFKFPNACPICNCDLLSSKTSLIMPPFHIPFPFTNALKTTCCVVIKPTTGNFLYTYQNSCDLHIGVTDSTGVVYEYKKDGIINTETYLWTECLAIEVISKNDCNLRKIWDSNLRNLFAQPSAWSSLKYNEENHNCYLFVLTFLRLLCLPYLFEYLSDRTLFCQKFILPQTLIAGKYITLFRKVLSKEFVVETKS